MNSTVSTTKTWSLKHGRYFEAGYTKNPTGTVRPTGARPSSSRAIKGAAMFSPSGTTPPNWIWEPQKLSYWLNNQDGDCVTAEEAFAKACSGIFIQDSVVQTWAGHNGVLNGAELDQVLDMMASAGFKQDGNEYRDGAKVSVDYTNAAALQNAISQGPVKIGVAAGQLQGVVGQKNGWFATGFRSDHDEDHCTCLPGYGTMAWLAQQLGVTVPSGIDPMKPAYAFFTWDTIGIIDVASMLAITGEAWLRTPTTILIGTNPPTPDPVFTPGPAVVDWTP